MFEGVLTGLVGLTTLGVVATLVRVGRVIHRYAYHAAPVLTDLPTVSVCIPARNEVHAMTECLERVLASDYPKLEIIVLDDGSVDDTSVLIKSFAHAGVRFVEGRPLPSGWLGKNNALQGLLDEASGELVLFLDVDTTLRASSVSKLVAHAAHHKVKLTSVLPQREDGLRASVFLGTLRYFWALFFGSSTYPAMSGACWLVDREELTAMGGFSAFKASTQPVEVIARELSSNARYELVISNSQLGISYEKKWLSQVETGIRLLRPLFGNTWLATVAAMALIALVVIPLAGLTTGLMAASMSLVVLSVLCLLLITSLSLRYYKTVWRYGWWLGAIHWPYVALQEAILILMSIYKYSRGTVTWKGRPITSTVRSAADKLTS